MLEVLFYLVVFTAGLAVGSVVSQVVSRRKTAYGYFVLNPIEDPDTTGVYTVGVKFDNSDLREKRKVILFKRETQK